MRRPSARPPLPGCGPLRLATFAAGRGFVTYQDLDGAGPAHRSRAGWHALKFYRDDPEITQVEWKTRGHDHAPGLQDALIANGFEADETESIMIGEASALNVHVHLPSGINLRQATEEPDIRALSAMHDEVFGGSVSADSAGSLLRRVQAADGMELWIAEHQGQVVSAGRLEPVADTDFAGIWGGATLKPWRGQGIYRG